MPPDLNDDAWDEQDQSEVFDEDNQELDDAGSPRADMKTLEELPDVIDVTTAVGDADDDAALIAEDMEDQEIIDLEADADMADFEDDELAGRMPEVLNGDRKLDDEGQEVLLTEEVGIDDADRRLNRASAAEVELVFAGDLDEASVEDADRASAESEVLADDDIDDLGYADDEAAALDDESDGDGAPGDPVRFEILPRNSLWVLLRDGEQIHAYGHADRAVHEGLELARELRSSGQPAVVHVQPADGKVIEVTDDLPPPVSEEERSAVVPARSNSA